MGMPISLWQQHGDVSLWLASQKRKWKLRNLFKLPLPQHCYYVAKEKWIPGLCHARNHVLLNKRCWSNGLSTHRRIKLESYFIPYTQIQLKMDHGLKSKSQHYKNLKGKWESFLHDLGLGGGFLELTLKALSDKKKKFNKLGSIKVKKKIVL